MENIRIFKTSCTMKQRCLASYQNKVKQFIEHYAPSSVWFFFREISRKYFFWTYHGRTWHLLLLPCRLTPGLLYQANLWSKLLTFILHSKVSFLIYELNKFENKFEKAIICSCNKFACEMSHPLYSHHEG